MDISPLGGAPFPLAADAAEPAPRPAADDPAYRAQAQAAAEKFEGLFIADLLRQMRRSTRELSADDSIYKDRVNDDMLDLADTLLADALAGRHAFGIADALLRQLLPARPVAAGDDLSTPALQSPSSDDSQAVSRLAP